jgi:hypothetical protein
LFIDWQISIVGPPLGEVDATCPHCDTRQNLVRRALRGEIVSIPIPSGEVLTCPACGKHSRKEGRADRWLGVAVRSSCLVVLAAGVATGLYILGSMLMGEFSGGFALVGVILISAPSYFAYRLAVSIRRLLRPSALVPMDGLLTRL